jgi:predicted metal-binding protein
MAAATIHVCVTCRAGEDAALRPGVKLAEMLDARLAGDEAIRLERVECLSVCKRPCTLALSAPGKWTYVVADLDNEANVEDVIDAARRYAATTDGIVPWRERPVPFRRNVVSRTPPLRSAS